MTTTDTTSPALCDCGHPPSALARVHEVGTGVAMRPDGSLLCYDCAEAEERAAFAGAPAYFSYLSGDGRTLTTWTGAELARVTSETVRTMSGFAGRHERTYVQAAAPDGSHWYGSGPGRGWFCRLHRAKGGGRRA